MEALTRRIDAHFKISERQSDIGTEIRAGFVTFLTMSYILLANPLVLYHSGIPTQDIVVGTAAASAVASFIGGFFGNLPFGCAPGLGLSAYFAYGLVNQVGLTWEACLTLCFVAGLITTILAITRVSEAIMKFIPECIKISTVVGMGMLISFIGLKEIHVVVADPDSLVRLGDMTDYLIWLAFVGLVIIATLRAHFKGALLFGIIFVTFLYWFITGNYPTEIASLPREKEAFWQIHFSLLTTDCIPGILAFLFIGIFDVAGVMFGVARAARLIEDPLYKPIELNEEEYGATIERLASGTPLNVLAEPEEDSPSSGGNVPGGVWIFIGTSVGTMVAAILGCSPIIVHVESIAGVDAGGKTGLTAVVISGLFTAALFFAPFLGSIPPCATSPVLIMLGTLMMQEAKNIKWLNMEEAVPAFFTMVIMPFTFSIPNGIAFGVVSYIAIFSASFLLRKGLSLCTRPEPAKVETLASHKPRSMKNQNGDVTLKNMDSGRNKLSDGHRKPLGMYPDLSQPPPPVPYREQQELLQKSLNPNQNFSNSTYRLSSSLSPRRNHASIEPITPFEDTEALP